ncbi:MAG: hypothetical protein HYZ25_20590 [Chloroflexi bacterium]|nr:hypothetical protein [Chloroflexota bacterium]
MRIKVVVLGGSSLSTPLLAEAIARCSPHAGYEIVLVGRNTERLKLVQSVSQEVIHGSKAYIQVSVTTDFERALEGAAYCVNQIRPGGLEGRLFDETFPHRFGIPGEETLGPGGFSNACRSLPVVLNFCHIMERSSPNIILLNLTNPCSLLQYAIRTYTNVNIIGLCELPVVMMEGVAGLLGIPRTELDFRLGGMNHHSWITAVHQAGRDRLPEVLAQVERLPKLHVDPELVRALGAIPSPFIRYYFHPDRILKETSGRPARAQELIELGASMLEDFQRWKPGTGSAPSTLRTRGAIWYEKIVAPLLVTLAEKRDGIFPLNIENHGALTGLPEKAVIETLVEVRNGILQPPNPLHFSTDIQVMLESHCAFEMLTAQAVVEHDRNKALRALLSDKLVTSFDQARQIVDEIFKTLP